MAFVSESTRKLNQISKTMCPLGPGQYFKDQLISSKRQCAPFQSTSRKRSILQPTKQLQPGPGNYEISKPFIQPNIKTVSNSQSIIVKINSTGTAQFKSVVDRFQDRSLQQPGPGEYSIDGMGSTKRKSLSSSFINDNKLANRIKSLGIKKNYPAIPQKIRGLTDSKKQDSNPEGKLGPAFYNPKKFEYVNGTSTVWAKDKSLRFSADNKSEVGPGKYNPDFVQNKQQDKAEQVSAHFKSNTVRTYFDSLFYKTNHSQTAKLRDLTHFKPKEPAPGQYQTNFSSLKIQQKPFALQFFGSTVERFPQQKIPQKKHKSFYNIKSTIGQDRSFNKSEHAFLADSLRKPQFLKVKSNQKIPGPGHYKENVKVEKKLRGNNIQKFGTSTKRMFQIQDKLDEIGPGKYTKDASKSNSPRNNKFGQIDEKSCNFKSSSTRDCFGIPKDIPKLPFAQYDVSQYDMAKKMQKQKNFIENLKKIDVQKAPFQSSISRFPHYQSKPKDDRKSSIQQARIQQLKVKQTQQKIRQMKLEANESQYKDVRKNHFGTTDRFQNQKKGAPGVGHYSVRSTWQKRSHNIKFSKK